MNSTVSRQTESRRTAFLALVLCNALWGFSFPLMVVLSNLLERHRISVAPIGPISESAASTVAKYSLYIGIRFICATFWLAVFRRNLVRATTAEEWRRGAVSGALFCIGITLQILGIRDLSASRSAFLTSLSVLFTPALMVLFERRLPSRTVLAGAALAILGTAVLTGVIDVTTGRWNGAQTLLLGDILTTLGSLAFALLLVHIDVLSTRMPAARISPGMFLGIAASSLTIVAICTLHSHASLAIWAPLFQDRQVLMLIVTMSLTCTFIPFHLMNAYQHFFSPAHASLIYTLEPIFATLWALVLPSILAPHFGVDYPNEHFAIPLLAGGFLILAGNALALIRS